MSFVLSLAPPLAASTYYVNDSDTSGDVYTTAVGNDATSGSASAPFLTIGKAMDVVQQGDRVYVDAGTYTESVRMSTNGIALIGADSQSTIIDPPGTSWNADNGIYANAQSLTIKKLRITDGACGILFDHVDNSVIQNVQSDANYYDGFYLHNGSDYNILTNNTASSNNVGFALYSSNNYNTLSNNTSSNNKLGFLIDYSSHNTLNNNTASSNSSYGFNLYSSSNNTLGGNTASSNNNDGFYITSSSNSNTLSANTASSNNGNGFKLDYSSGYNILNSNTSSNNWAGFELYSSSNNTLGGNTASSNNTGFYLYSSSNNTMSGNTASSNSSGFYLYSSSNNNVVKNNISVNNSLSGIFVPFPYGTGNSFTYNDVWNNASGNYSYGTSAGTGSISADPLFINDSDSTSADYLRLSANSPCIDIGDPADTVPSGGGSRIDIGAFEYQGSRYAGPIWYVNDTATLGDIYTTAIGNDDNSGASNSPFSTITKALTIASAGDTIYIDAGTYTESVKVSTSGVSLIGADSQSTIVDPQGTGISADTGISATNVTGITIRDLRITNGYYGINFDNVDSSMIHNVQSDNNYKQGFYLGNGSETNILSMNTSSSNGYGFVIDSSGSNTISNNSANNDSYSGFWIEGTGISHFNLTITADNYINGKLVKYIKNQSNITIDSAAVGTVIVYNSDSITIKNLNLQHGGIELAGATNSLIENNSVAYDSGGIYLFYSDTNMVRNNTINNNIQGFYIDSSSDNTIKNNIVTNNNGNGIYLSSGAGNLFEYNDVWNNSTDYSGASAGAGDISADPSFANDTDSAAADYLHLAWGSPCINAGDPGDTVPTGGRGRIDIGAFEYINNAPIANAGADTNTHIGRLDGSLSSDTEGDSLVYYWTQVSGTGVSISASDSITSFTPTSLGTYVFSLSVRDNWDTSAADTIAITITNATPVANAGSDTSIHIGNAVTLDGSSSSDADGDTLVYEWTQVSGETVALTGGNTPTAAAATPLLEGNLVFLLSVSDGWDTATDTVVITMVNTAPVANAGSDTSIHIGNVVTLDGSSSSDADGDTLSYKWSQVSGETVTIGDSTHTPSSDIVGVHPAQAGTYKFVLTVSDGWDTATDTVTITMVNTAPVANAGSDTSIHIGDMVTLDGSSSSDADNDTLSYEWTQVSGETVALTGGNTPTATAATPLREGNLTFVLTVSDGWDTGTDTVTITMVNTAPVANAGQDTSIHIGNAVTLDGSNSSDADGDTLVYEWTQVSGETVTIGDSTHTPSSDIVGVHPAQAGTYKFALTVSDGWDTGTDTVTITMVNTAPVANAGQDTSIHIGNAVTLAGSSSSDADGDTLSYEWTQVSGETVTIGDSTHTPSSDIVGVHPAQAGTYKFALTVSDGWDTATDTVTITMVNTASVANAGSDTSIHIGDMVTLDGSSSSDADGDTLVYKWTQVSGETITIGDSTHTPSSDSVGVHPAQAGTYKFVLAVSDGWDTATDTVVITVTNTAPTAKITTESTAITTYCTQIVLTGSSSSDSDADNLSFLWKSIGDTAVLSNSSESIVSFAPSGQSEYKFVLYVTDGWDTGTDTITISYKPHNFDIAGADTSAAEIDTTVENDFIVKGVEIDFPANSLSSGIAKVELYNDTGVRNNSALYTNVQTATNKLKQGFTAIGYSVINLLKANGDKGSGVLSKAAKLKFHFDMGSNGYVKGTTLKPETLKIYRMNETTLQWEEITDSGVCRINTTDNTIEADVLHFSSFAVIAGAPASSNYDNIKVYPNPFVPAKAYNGKLKIINLTATSKVEIYSLDGVKVWEATPGQLSYGSGYYGAAWDGKDLSGADVSSGVYVYYISDDNGYKKVGKITVIR